MKKGTCISLLLLLFSLVQAQSTYFNKGYLVNGFSPALSIIEDQNNFVFWGVTIDSLDNNESSYIASIDSAGNILYWNTISDPQNEYWAGYRGALKKTIGSGYIAAGSIDYPNVKSNAILFRFNHLGDTLWTHQYPDTLTNMWTLFWNCNTTVDNGFVGIGYHTVAPYNGDVFLVKTDSTGKEQWRQEYGHQTLIEMGYSVVQSHDNGYLLGCYRYVAGNNDSGDPYVIKVDSIGSFQWERNLGGPYRDFFTQVCIGNDGNYIAGTSIADSVIQENFYTRIKIFKHSPNGEIIWEKYYGQTELDNKLYAIYPDHDGGYIAAGRRKNLTHPGNWNRSFGWLLKIAENGDSIWYREYRYLTIGNTFNDLWDICLSPDKGYALAGQAWSFSDPQRAWIIKVDSMGCDTPGCSTGVGIYMPNLTPQELNLYLFPNPANDEINCQLSRACPERSRRVNCQLSMYIYDLYGRKQDEIIIPQGQEQIRIDVSSYPDGVYIVVHKSEDGNLIRGKFIKSDNR